MDSSRRIALDYIHYFYLKVFLCGEAGEVYLFLDLSSVISIINLDFEAELLVGWAPLDEDLVDLAVDSFSQLVAQNKPSATGREVQITSFL